MMRTNRGDYVEITNLECESCSIQFTRINEQLESGCRSVRLILDHDEVRALFKDFFPPSEPTTPPIQPDHDRVWSIEKEARPKPTLVWDKKDFDPACPHTEQFLEYTPGEEGFWMVCWACGAVVDGGMAGHN